MLLCFVLCAAAVLPTAFTDKLEAQHVQQPVGSNGEVIRKLSAFVSSLRNQPQIHLQTENEERPLVIKDDTMPSLHDVYIPFWYHNPYPLTPDLDSTEIKFLKSPLEGGHYLLRRDTVLDSIGGGHLLRREARLDSLGGGHLLKRQSGFGALDPLGGGHLLKREFNLRQLDSIGGGHLLKRGNEFTQLDSIGGGHLLKKNVLDSIGGGYLLKRYQLDSLGGGHLLKRELDSVGGERPSGKILSENTKELNPGYYMQDNENLNFLPDEPLIFTRNLRNGRDFDTLLGRSFGTNKRDFGGKRNFDEIDNAGFKDYLYKRNFDEIINAGFRNNLEKRNFDEIDNAGFRDNLKRRNFDEIDNTGFQDYLYKRNFDEIDNAGFTDYLSKRNAYETDNFGFRSSPHWGPPNEVLLKELFKSCRTDKCKKKVENFLSRSFSINKRNFDEIDNAGFRDYLYKRNSPATAQNSMLAATA